MYFQKLPISEKIKHIWFWNAKRQSKPTAFCIYLIKSGLNVKSEVHDIAILNYIFLAFDANLSSFPTGRF